MTSTAAHAIKGNIGQDLGLAAQLANFEAEQEAEGVDAMTTAQRRALNALIAEWWC